MRGERKTSLAPVDAAAAGGSHRLPASPLGQLQAQGIHPAAGQGSALTLRACSTREVPPRAPQELTALGPPPPAWGSSIAPGCVTEPERYADAEVSSETRRAGHTRGDVHPKSVC